MNSNRIVNELLLVIFQIENQLVAIQTAFQDNQVRGEQIRDEIKKIESEGTEVPPKINEEMRSITCLREWHWKYIDRYTKFVSEASAICSDFKEIANSSGLFVERKRSKILKDVDNFTHLGQTYIATVGDVFERSFSKLVPGEDIRSEALKLMSQRLASANKTRH